MWFIKKQAKITLLPDDAHFINRADFVQAEHKPTYAAKVYQDNYGQHLFHVNCFVRAENDISAPTGWGLLYSVNCATIDEAHEQAIRWCTLRNS